MIFSFEFIWVKQNELLLLIASSNQKLVNFQFDTFGDDIVSRDCVTDGVVCFYIYTLSWLVDSKHLFV